MCFILTAIRVQENESAKGAIIDILKKEQNSNNDGSASLVMNLGKDGKYCTRHNMSLGFTEMRNDLDQFEVCHWHFRAASKGAVTLDNTHFWRKGDWTFAHNGGIWKLGDDKGLSDSYEFFQQLTKRGFLSNDSEKIDWQGIKDYSNQIDLWGRFVLVNLKTKASYFFGDFECYLLNRSYLAITSASALFENKIESYGIRFKSPDSLERLNVKLEGIHCLDPNDKKIYLISPTFKEYKYGGTGYDTSKKYKSTLEDDVPNYPKAKGFQTPLKGILRSDDSFREEFEHRLTKYCKKHPTTDSDIGKEIEESLIGADNMTPTERKLWNRWIQPQIDAQQRRIDKKVSSLENLEKTKLLPEKVTSTATQASIVFTV